MWEKIKAKLWSKTGKLVLAVLLSYLVIMAAAALIVDGRHVRFYMSAAQQIQLEHGEEYVEPGIYAVTNGRLFGEGQRRLPIEVRGEVDGEKLGSQELSYVCHFFFREYMVSRTVEVIDTKAPEITLKSTEGYEASWLEGYQEEGYTAFDSCDGDLTDQVEVEITETGIRYTVSDASGNRAEAFREPVYRITEPVITLKGDAVQQMTARTDYQDPGFRAADSLGNDLTEHVQVEGEVIPYEPGEYTLSYTITNALGQSVSVTRTVTVTQAYNPESVSPGEKTIYLTFDDGPGPYTDALLNVLSRYNAKATFFVTGLNGKYEDCIGRAYREGHSIGVHSLTHNYYEIYESEEAFFNDFNAMQEIIYSQTGAYTDLCRFPGGSSNTVSSFNSGIMSRLSYALESMGYQYFDWNVSSGDAGGTTDTDEVAANVINGIAGRHWAVVLQHDIKDYSVGAVEQILIWGLNNGYTFRGLDSTSPTAHHGIAN